MFYCVLASGFTGKGGGDANSWVWISVTKMDSAELEATNTQEKTSEIHKGEHGIKRKQWLLLLLDSNARYLPCRLDRGRLL